MNEKIFSKSHFENFKIDTSDNFECIYFTRKSPLKDTVNEDSIGIIEISKDRYVLVVADGAGGYPKGEDASEKIIQSIFDKIKKLPQKYDVTEIRNSILDGIEWANETLIKEAVGSKSTVTVCEIIDKKLRAYNVGDSGLLVCGQRGKLKYKTLSHSPVGYGIEAGLISEDEALTHPDLNIVDNLVGTPEMTIEIGPRLVLDDKDTVLLASDGLFDNFQIDSLNQIIRKGSLGEVGKNIIDFYDQGIIADPNGEEIKFDDLSFFICRTKS